MTKVGHPRVLKVEAGGWDQELEVIYLVSLQLAWATGDPVPKQTPELSDSQADKKDLPGQPEDLPPETGQPDDLPPPRGQPDDL